MVFINIYRKLIWLFILVFSAQSLFSQIAERREVTRPGFTQFIPNKGQWQKQFNNKASLGYGTLFNNLTGYKILLWNNLQMHELMEEFHFNHELVNDHIIDYHALHFSFVNSLHQKIQEEYKIPSSWECSFYIGNDSSKWRTHIQPYYQYTRKNVYSRIHFQQSTLGDHVKSEWRVLPQGRPQEIAIKITGAHSTYLSESGHLVIETSVGNLVEEAPKAWQIIDQKKSIVDVKYVLRNNTVSYELGSYNPNYPLIIDPVLVFSTYSGSVSDNFGFTATYDSKGHLYAGGISNDAGGKYPVTSGAYQDTFSGGDNSAPVNLPSDITISKYSPDGTNLLYATYLGGNLNDYPHSLVVNSKDELYLLGTTKSNNFPTVNAFDATYNGNTDILLAHFNEDCSQLLQCTYFGGSGPDGLNANLSSGTLTFNYADEFRGDILTDELGNVYIATCSRSSNFPTSDSASQLTKDGNRDAVVFSLDSNLSKLRFSTFWGGSNDDAAYSIKMNSTGELYVGGGTASTDFPITDSVYSKNYFGGRADGFVIQLDTVYGRIKKSTTYGTSSYDQVYFIDIDLQDRVYLAGQTEGNISRTSGTYGKDNTTQFIASMDSALKNIVFQTTFGNRTSNPELSPTAFLVDNCYNIYFSGWGSTLGGGTNPGTTQGLETKNANWPNTDGEDFYLIVLNREAKGLVYASFIGGNQSGDHVDGGTSRFDKNGIVYQSVCASCPPPGTSQLSDFPTTSSSIFPSNPSIRCSNASFKLDFEITYFTEARFNLPNKLCIGNTISPINTGQGTSFLWDFGDGTLDTNRNPTHTYQSPGIYTVQLFAVDSLACNIADTFIRQIEILERPESGFEVEYNPCEPDLVTFKNIKPDLNTTQSWDLGDGTLLFSPPTEYRYSKDGSYQVQQITELPNGCKDTSQIEIILSSTAGGSITLYNTFTPNNDNFNTCWQPENVNVSCEEVITKIYNRYGTLVFNSEKDGTCWNGRIKNNGPEVAQGSYYYVIQVKRVLEEEKKEIYGVIQLFR